MNPAFDAIVIGAGVLGASLACRLAQQGYRVLILERGNAVCGASGGNLGQISISDRAQGWHMPLALESQAYYRGVLSRAHDIEYVPSGGSVVLKGEEQLAAGQKAMDDMAALGVPFELYNGADIHRIEPHINLAAMDALLFCPDEGKLNPLLTTLAFLDEAQKAGAVLKRNTPVISFEKQGRRITAVLTPQARFESEWVVNCTGPGAAFVGNMAGVPIPIRFHKGTAFVSQPVAPIINGPITGGGMFLDAPAVRPQRHIGFGTLQTADGSIIIAQSTEECAPDDRAVNMPSLQLVARRFLTYYPQLRGLQIVRAWAATTTYTQDDLPVFGFSEQAENLLTVAGFKGAFTVAPAVGRIAWEALQGRMDPLYTCCAPDRPVDTVAMAQ